MLINKTYFSIKIGSIIIFSFLISINNYIWIFLDIFMIIYIILYI